MCKILKISLVLLSVALLSSCEKETKNNDEKNPSDNIELIIDCPDTFFVSHDTIFNLDVRGIGGQNNDLLALWSTSNSFLTSNVDRQTFGINEYGRFSIKFDQFNVVPSTYSFEVLLSYESLAMAAVEKRVYVVYKPTCAYGYTSYSNANITYVINQELVNKAVHCSYSTNGTLLVDDLTPFTLDFEINCSTNALTLKPYTYMGDYITGSGRIVNGVIEYTLWNGGNPHASGVIRP